MLAHKTVDHAVLCQAHVTKEIESIDADIEKLAGLHEAALLDIRSHLTSEDTAAQKRGTRIFSRLPFRGGG